jgi:hypothetical protein
MVMSGHKFECRTEFEIASESLEFAMVWSNEDYQKVVKDRLLFSLNSPGTLSEIVNKFHLSDKVPNSSKTFDTMFI